MSPDRVLNRGPLALWDLMIESDCATQLGQMGFEEVLKKRL